MSAREVIAYAITHAPPGVKGGPYEGDEDIGEQVASLGNAGAGRGGTTRLWEAAENDEDAAVDAYRKAGGK